MPDLVLPDVGLNRLWRTLLKAETPSVNWVCKLFKNDFTPDEDTIISDLTECDFTNYTPATVTRAGWSSPTVVANQAVGTWGTTALTWICGATGNDVYGLWVEWADDNSMVLAQRFDTMRALTVGKVLTVLPQFKFFTAP